MPSSFRPVLAAARYALLGLALGAAHVSLAQIRDDFSNPSNWAASRAFGTGTLQVQNGVATYTTGSMAESFSTLTFRPAIASYTQNWNVQVDVHMAPADSFSPNLEWLYATLNVMRGGDVFDANNVDSFHIFGSSMARKPRPGAAQRNFFNAGHKRPGQDFFESPDVPNPSTDGALRVSFDAATKVLTASYDANGATGGYTWTTLYSLDIDAPGSTWNMNDASTFVIVLTGDSNAVVPAGAVTLDNMVATGFFTPSAQAISNVSLRTLAGSGDATLLMGFSIGGGSGGGKQLLFRGIGPSLGEFGVTGFLANPVLSLSSTSATGLRASNDDWGDNAEVRTVSAQVGAFPLPAASRDSALYLPAVPQGSYTVEIVGSGGATGAALAEIYDATPAGSFSSATPRLTNISARTVIASDDTLFIGFVVGGNQARRILIRAIGPGLAAFGVGGTNPDPTLTVFRGATAIGGNDNWNRTAIGSAFAQVAAFDLPAGSRDAAIVLPCEPAAYTVHVRGVGTAAGITLVELYELP